MTFRDWAPWGLDVWTWGWIVFIVFFFVWEVLSGLYGGAQQLTHHLRPVFLSVPFVWFVALGVWLWLGIHLLAPTLEEWILRSAG